MRDLREKGFGIHIDGVSAGRFHDRNPQIGDQFSEVFHLRDTRVKILVFSAFHQSRSQSFHIASAHSAVGDESFKDDTKSAACLIGLFVSQGDEAADIDDSVFLGAHRHPLGIGEHLFHDGFDRFILITCFPHLDEVSIFSKAG
ncbi:hypothetical protein DSECCO2_505340 [anaerobic digester metagenome]